MRTTLMNQPPRYARGDYYTPRSDRGAVRRLQEDQGLGQRRQWFVAVSAGLAIATGCVVQYELSRSSKAARVIEPAASATQADLDLRASRQVFQERLQSGYLDLAMAAYERRAFAIADFFAHRSIKAGGARTLAPIAPDFDAPAEAASARRDLVNRLNRGGLQEQPEQAALAQLAVDCWLRESRPDGAFDVRAACRRQARTTLAAIGAGPNEAELAMHELQADEGLAPERASAALAALVEHWRPALARSRDAAVAIARPVAASLRRRAEAAPQNALPVQEGVEEQTAVSKANEVESVALHVEPAEAVAAARDAAPTDESGEAAIVAKAPPPRVAEAPSVREIALPGFEFGSARMHSDARRLIRKQVVEGAARRAARVTIEGYTDSAGSADFNLSLSEKRAAAVRDALVLALGGETPPIEIRAYGEENLAVATADGVKEARNRRVVIRFQ